MSRDIIIPAAVGGLILVATALGGGGCQDSAAPPRITVPPPGDGPMVERDEVRPLRERGHGPAAELPPPPFDDVPIVVQSPPEQRAFLEAYEEVGRPAIAVFVNRGFDAAPLGQDRVGPPNELATRSIDYEAIENILTDWLAADGQVEILSSTGVRERLTDRQERDLEGGRLQNDEDTARRLGADVLVQVRARTTRQADEGPGVRMVAEAINIRGGQSIGRAVVDVPPPLSKPQINKYTRFLSRKLQDGMIGSWRRMAADDPPDRRPPAGEGADDPADDDGRPLREPAPRPSGGNNAVPPEDEGPDAPPAEQETPPAADTAPAPDDDPSTADAASESAADR